MSIVSCPAPDFRMASTKNLNLLNEDVALGDYRGRWLVLLFYPADFTFVCPTEMLAFNQRLDDFAALECDVVGVSTDGVHCHQAWQEFALGKLGFPLASDQTLEVSRAYGVLIEDEGVARRGLFIIDPEGTIRYQVVHDLDSGRSPSEVLRVLQGLQTAARVPAEWTPGSPTLASA